MDIETIELNRKQMNELDTWMRNFAYNFAIAIEPSNFIQNPIQEVKDRHFFEQKEVLCKIGDVEDKVLAEVARILGVPSVERSKYNYLFEDIEMIVEYCNIDIDTDWQLEALYGHLNLVRCWHSFREIWEMRMDHLVPECERPTQRRKVVVELDLETLDNQYVEHSSLQDELKNVIGLIGRVHGIQTFDQNSGKITDLVNK